MVYLAYTLQIVMMLGFPIGLWLYLRRKWNASWGLIGAGVVTFVASQVIHLPLNGALGLLEGGRGVALWPLPLMALVAGLSAGLCEEGARYIVYRFWRKDARAWDKGVVFGAGHGGGESLIFGSVMALSFLSMLVLKVMGLEMLHLSGDELTTVQAQVQAFWAVPWYQPLLAGVERAFAMTLQIAFSLLVLRSVVTHNAAWFVAAVAGHTLVDGLAVYLSQSGWSVPALESVVFLLALGGLAVIRALKTCSWEPLETPAGV